MEEVWKDVVGYEGLYQVSSMGVVKSMPKRTRKGVRLMRFSQDGDGYFSVELYRNGVSKRKKVHLMVAEAFLGERPEGMLCCHRDGNNQNNCLINLRWDTPSANRRDDLINGVAPIGEKNMGGQKLKETDIREIKRRLGAGETGASIARMFGVTPQMICYIKSGKQWSHVL